MVHFDIKNN